MAGDGLPRSPAAEGERRSSPQDWGAGGGTANPVDLHTHSIHSDGVLAPAALVQEANRRGLRVLGLTDHDTLDGLPEAETEAAVLGLEIVPGVELSTAGRDGEGEVHLLGYFVARDDPDLRAGLATYAQARLDRMERILERLAAAGVPIEAAHVRRLAGPGTVGRPHVARALIERGHVADIGEAFDRYLGAGRPGFVPRPKVEPEQGIALIRGAGGVAVLAHPLSIGDVEGVVARLLPAGLGGIEVYYGEYDEGTRRALRDVADRRGLVPTGGSDFHGPGFKTGRDLGGPPVPWETVERLRAAAGERAGRA
jgi:predicted metal-dependent phosphoesterase TrpH